MKKFDFQMIVVIWVVSFLLSVVSAWFFWDAFTHDPATGSQYYSPSAEFPTTTWLTAPATNIAREVHWLWGWTALTILPFLFGPILLLVYCIARFSKAKNPRAATFHENVPLEIFWTITPAFFLVAMAVPAYGVLRKMDYPDQKPDVIVDVVGAQYYWQYSFPRSGVTVTDDGTGKSPLVLPVDQVIYMNGQSHQVNHAWWVPAFGIKYDVIPGRINHGWFRTEHEGFFKGQCAELCGALHAWMWIHVDVVTEEEFFLWLYENEAEFPLEDRAKVEAYIGADAATEMFGDRQMIEI